MTARRKRREADSESSIYLGRHAVGNVIVRDGQVTATDANGNRFGVYKTGRQAMAAIIAAAKPTPPEKALPAVA